MNYCKLLAAATVLAAAGSAHAAHAEIDGIGGSVVVRPHAVAGVFGAAAPTFTTAALATLHAALNADGVVTDGYVTSMFIETDAGLAWAVLVDKEFGGFEAITSDLAMTTSADSSNARFINDSGSDITGFLDPGTGIQTAAGSFAWDADNEGEGFAWAGIQPGDFISFNFTRSERTHPGLNPIDTFQFVNWDSTLGKFVVVASRNFTQNNQFAYSVTFAVPLAQPALLGMAGLAGVGCIRRRKMS